MTEHEPAEGRMVEAAVAILNEEIRPLLHIHGGEARVVGADAETGRVDIELLGACARCALAPWTFSALLRPRLTRSPEIDEIRVKGVNVSQQALKRMADMFPEASRHPAVRQQHEHGGEPSDGC
jgi:Fe-S cluster biogenesis protein NfuA